MNIDFLRARDARYLVGTPKGQLKKFQAQLLDGRDWSQVQPGVEVKLVAHPDNGSGEQYILCRSNARRQKESRMVKIFIRGKKPARAKVSIGNHRRFTDTGQGSNHGGRPVGR